MYCDNFYTANTETPVSMDISDLTNITPSTFPPLPSPIHLPEHHCEDLDVETSERESHHESIDPLTLEMEVQDLIDRVTVLEDGHAHILEVQKSILLTQEEILSRLAALEKQEHRYPRTPSHSQIPVSSRGTLI